ncbi:MAG: Crp/Fnr family transcriptional regulator [Verrucomicrobia bacterium]|nr:Crp/Fnr family transcriptional regulator [Verrucomicrobiota bacterium]
MRLHIFHWEAKAMPRPANKYRVMKRELPSKPVFRNRILARLPKDESNRLQSKMQEVEMKQGTMLYEPHKPFRRVYFPETGVASIVTVLDDNTEIEVATVGYEGMVGLPAFLGVHKSPAKAFWQVDGKAFVLDAKALREETQRGSALAVTLHLYIQAFFTQIAQSATCNRVHKVKQRCARWLLMTHDRVEGDEFGLTQEFLARMLGIRRTGVTEVAGDLQRGGLIAYSRGHIRILNRVGLEKISCECHRVVMDEYRRLLG